MAPEGEGRGQGGASVGQETPKTVSKSPEAGGKHGRVPSPHHSIEGTKSADTLDLVCITYICGIAFQI